MSDRWFWFKRGGWSICVNAISRNDAREHIGIHAPGAAFQGERTPTRNDVMTTGMVTAKREAQIHEFVEQERREWIAQGKPGEVRATKQ